MHNERIIVKDKELSPEIFKIFSDLIYEKCAIFLDESKLDSLRISLLTRVTKKNLHGYMEYYRSLKADCYGANELKELLNLITINETSFFRTPDHFNAFREVVLPEIIKRKSDTDRTIRIWTAGCSTGEEAYSIAMTAIMYLLMMGGWKVQILATDISERVLELAEKGIYTEKRVNKITPNLRKLFFEKIDENKYAVKDNLKNVIKFKYFNLISTPYPLSEMRNWDIIFCRNVTIYFKIESTKRVIHNFYQSLAECGYLFVGHSESLNNISKEFTLVEATKTFFYCKSGHKILKKENINNYPHFTEEDKTDFKLRTNVTKTKKDKNNILECRTKDKKALETDVSSIRETGNLSERTELILKEAEDLFNKGKVEDAEKTCIEIESIDPLLWEAYFLLGMIYNDTGKIDDAVIQFKKVIYINPHYFFAHYYLGNIYQKKGLYHNAVASFNNAKEYLNKKDCGIDKDRFIKGITNRGTLIRTCEKNIMDMEREAEND